MFIISFAALFLVAADLGAQELPKATAAKLAVHGFTVGRATGTIISEQTIDIWMSSSSAALQNDNTGLEGGFFGTDTSCPVKFARNGAILVLPLGDLSVMNTAQDYVAIRDAYPYVDIKIVDSIQFCPPNDRPDLGVPSMQGCATPNEYPRRQSQLVLADPQYIDSERIIIAHEFGHTRALTHPSRDVDIPRWVMNLGATNISDVVIRPQCSQFLLRRGSGIGGLRRTAPLETGFSESYLVSLGTAAKTFLLANLFQSTDGVHLTGIASHLVLFGDIDQVDAEIADGLRRFFEIQVRRHRDIGRAEDAVTIALRGIAIRGGDRGADYLIRWITAKGYNAVLFSSGSRDVKRDLIYQAIRGLGESGNPRARDFLMQLRGVSFAPYYDGAEIEEFVSRFVEVNDEIQRIGKKAYQKEVMKSAPRLPIQ